MTRVSVASLRVTNPLVEVTLACDNVTANALERRSDPILREVEDLVTCEAFTNVGANYRNRHLKTQTRQIVDGPFLLLDSDTLVRGDLSSIFRLDTDIAGAPNHSRDEFANQLWDEDARALGRMNWQVEEHAYINGGVLYFSDTPAARKVGCLWHRKWLASIEKCSRYRDQPALNAALCEAQPRLSILPHKFNAQFRVAPHVAANAVIWHYYSSGYFTQPTTDFELLAAQILLGKEPCLDVVAEMIRQPGPWRQESKTSVQAIRSRFRSAVKRLLNGEA